MSFSSNLPVRADRSVHAAIGAAMAGVHHDGEQPRLIARGADGDATADLALQHARDACRTSRPSATRGRKSLTNAYGR